VRLKWYDCKQCASQGRLLLIIQSFQLSLTPNSYCSANWIYCSMVCVGKVAKKHTFFGL